MVEDMDSYQPVNTDTVSRVTVRSTIRSTAEIPQYFRSAPYRAHRNRVRIYEVVKLSAQTSVKTAQNPLCCQIRLSNFNSLFQNPTYCNFLKLNHQRTPYFLKVIQLDAKSSIKNLTNAYYNVSGTTG